MRKAKIVATIGPASDKRDTLRRMIEAGMDVARLNMSHGTHESHARTVAAIREAARLQGREVAILLDLAGPKIRLGELDGAFVLESGTMVELTTEEVVGVPGLLPVRYPYLARELKPGDRFSIADGLIDLEVDAILSDTRLRALVQSGGTVSSRKGVNLPTGGEGLPSLTDKDVEDLRFGLGQGIDWVSLSFVRKPADADRVRAVMDEVGIHAPVMAKVEKQQALDNLDAILQAFDGLVVARGDLGVEVELTDLPAIQKRIIRAANRASKPVITATQMLLSMVHNKHPTRAEVTDVANAILDGTDAVMLSEETAMGEHPVKTVSTMAAIATRAADIHEEHYHDVRRRGLNLPDAEAIARATCMVADEVGADCIVTPTSSGSTTRLISALRPNYSILALSTEVKTVRRLSVLWGVKALLMEHVDDTDALFEHSRRLAVSSGLARPGQKVVVTAGVPLHEPGTTNLLKIIHLH